MSKQGNYGEGTRRIVKTYNMKIDKVHYEPEEGKRETVALSIRPLGYRKSIFWNLTAMTEEELVAMRDLIYSAFDAAYPLCVQRDKEAVDAYEAGDTSDPRIYRAAPLVVDRESGKRPHSALLSKRREAVPSGDGADEHRDGDVRGESSGVAEQQPEGVGAEDDATP